MITFEQRNSTMPEVLKKYPRSREERKGVLLLREEEREEVL